MRRIAIIAAFLALFVSCAGTVSEQPEVSVIPRPQSVRVDEGTFCISKDTKVHLEDASEEILRIVGFLNEKLSKAAGFELQVVDARPYEDAICFVAAEMPSESYAINVQPAAISVEYGDGAGAFYALQTLFQLLPVEIFAQERQKGIDWVVPCCAIEDAPRFQYLSLIHI